MPAPTEALCIGALVALLGCSSLSAAERLESKSALKLDKALSGSSPFRLSIARGEYRVSGAASSSGGRHKATGDFSPAVERHAKARGLDPNLVHAVIRAESAYRPSAISPKGAVGLMQVMPATGRRFGVEDLESPESNLRAGTAYLRHLLDRFNNVPLALAAYNAGEGAVIRYGHQIPPYTETQGYVRGILREYQGVEGLGGGQRIYSDGLLLTRDGLSQYRLVDAKSR